MDNKSFTYQYSAARHNEVERIRKKYLPSEENKLDKLKKLDAKAQTAGQRESLSIGIGGALLFSIGVCFALDLFGGAKWLSILFGILGALAMMPAYPICKRIAKKKKEELTPEILRLSEEIMKIKKDLHD